MFLPVLWLKATLFPILWNPEKNIFSLLFAFLLDYMVEVGFCDSKDFLVPPLISESFLSESRLALRRPIFPAVHPNSCLKEDNRVSILFS